MIFFRICEQTLKKNSINLEEFFFILNLICSKNQKKIEKNLNKIYFFQSLKKKSKKKIEFFFFNLLNFKTFFKIFFNLTGSKKSNFLIFFKSNFFFRIRKKIDKKLIF